MAENDPMEQAQEVLSQSEVERLLAQVTEQESQSVVHNEQGERKNQTRDSIQTYDFRHPVFLSANELRKLRVEHEEYIQRLAALLSIYLRMEFTLQMSKLQTVPYLKFTESISNPAHLTMFKVEPMRGVCVLDINPRLGLTIVDRLMGGAGHSVNVSRDLSEIEVALLDQAIQIIIGEWCNHWAKMKELRPVFLGHENNGRFLQTSAPDAILLVLSMEARMGDCLEQIQIAFPYLTIEPLIQMISEQLHPEGVTEKSIAAAMGVSWRPEMESVRIAVKGSLTPVQFTAGNLAQIQVGDFIPLDPEAATNVLIQLQKMPKFEGRLGVQNQKWAVEITRVL